MGGVEATSSIADELFEETDLLLTQKFLPTEFDWRVGVLAGEPLFVCQYRMARGEDQVGKDEIWIRVLKWFIERFAQ